nr:MAG TPA: hypothetical protein [Caudoviricetes sp.]
MDTVSSFRTIHSISEICMVLKNKVSLVSLHQWTYGPLMINIKNL